MKIAAILFAAFLMVTVILVNFGLGSSFYDLVHFLPGKDKTGHFLLFGIMSYFFNTALDYEKISIYGLKILKASFILILIVTIEEISQFFIPSRTCSWLDLLFSYAGIFCFARIALILSYRYDTGNN